MSGDSSSSDPEQPSTSRRAATPIKKRKIRHELLKQKTYVQKFKPEWLQNPQFKGWLSQHPDVKRNDLCKCIACGVELKCGKSELEKHAVTAKHKKNVTRIQGLQPLHTFFQKDLVHNRKVQAAEVKLSNFFAHHNVAFQIVDHLVPLLKDCFSDSKVLNGVKLGRTKSTNIIKNVIAEKETQDLTKLLQQKFFSVLIDESTDISLQKLLCVVVKYIDDDGNVCDKLLELITVDAKNCNAENLFASFKHCLESKNIPLKKIVGLASDNASVMLGRNNSFMTRLQSETDALIVVPCICHSSALVASNACSKLPRTPEEFIRSVASYFSMSPKRTTQLQEMQEFFKAEQTKMLKLSATRWLSMQHAVKRVLENWNVLLHFFRVATVEENSKIVNFIFAELNNNCTKAILLFLSYFLNFFNTFNALFQGKKLLIPELSSECKKLFKQVILHFIKPEYINDFKINCKNPRNCQDLKEIDLHSFVLDLPDEIQITIRKSCLEFLMTAATDMQARFPLTDVFFDSLKFLNPQVALSVTKPDNLKSLQPVWSKFAGIDVIVGNLIDLEWKQIALTFSEEGDCETQTLKKMKIEEFWHTLANRVNFQDAHEFPNITNLAQLCMALPHSNAQTERVFSVVTDIKTKKRNKMGSEAINAVCVIRFSTSNCYQNFDVTPNHLKLMSSNQLYSTKN